MRVTTLFNRETRNLEKRKGGGGRGGGGSSGGSAGGSGGGGRSVSLGSGAGGRTSATAYGSGGGRSSVIPPGQPFAGRSEGGGTRNDVYGTNQYGSGYPSGAASQRGVAGLGFPFFFWPVVWGGAAGVGTAAYLHSSEYGDTNNSSRPGGPLFQAPFQSATQNTTLHVIADNSTTVSLIESIGQNCTSLVQSPSTITASAFDSNATNALKPEQAIQYYRASSVVLTLDGYNNTAALSDDTSLPSVPLPSWIDQQFLDCVNLTIGAAVPLIDAAPRTWGDPNGLNMFALVGLVLTLLQVL